MTIQQHENYKYEAARLKYTKKHIDHHIKQIAADREQQKENIKQAMVDLDPADSSQSYIAMLTNTEFLKAGADKHTRLASVKNKPYFGRIDFRENGHDQPKRYYIGKVALDRKKDNQPIIIDWRAPISNIYYEGRLGNTDYESPSGTVSGDLSLKRQFVINEGKIDDFMDIDITANDAFLQAALHTRADNRLKDIASTIQAEQNKVIRADATKPLIVQGVAGSGKTTIALHRIAYLMYNYGDQLIPENFLIIAPNRLFINYISNVLPELGVERTRQLTFIDFSLGLIGEKFRLTNPNEKLIQVANVGRSDTNQNLLLRSAAFKGTACFKRIVDTYITTLERQIIPQRDLVLGQQVIFTAEDVNRLFFSSYHFLPLFRRVEAVKKVLNNKLQNVAQKMLNRIQEHYNKRIETVRIKVLEPEQRRLMALHLAEERNEKLAEIKESAKTQLKTYFNSVPKRDVYWHYHKVITDQALLQEEIAESQEPSLIEFLVNRSSALFKKKQIEYEDLAALIYLQHQLFGTEETMKTQHVVIDEAQDLSSFQFFALKHVLHTRLFTILGDISQGIHAYRSIQSWDEVITNVFPDDQCQFLTLVQSYRTTVEIMNFANEIILQLKSDNIAAKPVLRHGPKPKVLATTNFTNIALAIKAALHEEENVTHQSFAVICKTAADCELVHASLMSIGVDAAMLTGEELAYQGGLVLLPSYIAKGLEFDLVFIVNAEDQYESNDIDIKLLYVASTRALHRLYLAYVGDEMPLLQNVSTDVYECWEVR